MKKLFGVLLMICGIFILFHLFAKGDIIAWFSNNPSQHQSYNEPDNQADNQSIKMAGVQNINIHASSENIHIIPENRQDLAAVLHGKGADRYDLDVNRHGDTVKVNLDTGWFNWFSFLNGITLDIYVPQDYEQNMDVDLSSGHLTFNGPSKDSPMKLDQFSLNMSSGNADLKHLNINQLKQKGSSGTINAAWIKTEEASFKISSGNIDLKHYIGPVDARLSSGKFTAQIDQMAGTIDVNESSGKITLDLPENADFTLDGDVSSGNINCEFPLENQKIHHNHLEGSHGSGKHKVKLRSSSGSINIVSGS